MEPGRLAVDRAMQYRSFYERKADTRSQCFLSIPAIIYLVMVPMWSRTKKFANAYAFVAVDILYTSKTIMNESMIHD